MKSLFTILFLALSMHLWACDCSTETLLAKVAASAFVAKAKILKITPNRELSEYHDIEIELIDLYKGDSITKLMIYSDLNSSCSFFTPENSTWLIFAAKDRNGILSFSFCSGAEQLDRKFSEADAIAYPNAERNYQHSLEFKLQVLTYLKVYKINPVNNYQIATSFKRNSFGEFKGTDILTRQFALYKLTIRKDLSIKNIQALKEFDNEKLKTGLPDCIMNNIRIYLSPKQSEIPGMTEIIIGLYYYPAEKGDTSFIGEWDL